MNWADYLSDFNKLKAIFGDKPPSLKDVDLHDVVLDRDGPKVILRFDVSEFPEAPPTKWLVSGFNRVQLKLMVLGIQDLSIQGWGTRCRCDISISFDDKRILLEIDDVIKIRIEGDHLLLEGINAYQNS